jgi:hypothetical protein
MATAYEYFRRNKHLEILSNREYMDEKGLKISVDCSICYDFEGGSKYIKIFIPECEHPELLLEHFLKEIDDVWGLAAGIEVASGTAGHHEKLTHENCKFSGRILVWTPALLEDGRLEALNKEMKNIGLSLVVRDARYVDARNKHAKPIAFISHDSRDKEGFVRELANSLTKSMFPVWYDEYSLRPGDSLRESIEKGLKECPKCIIVLSRNFFENTGWVKREFETIYTREIIDGERRMIPVWLDVTREEVYNYSPILADRVGIPANLGVEGVVRKLITAGFQNT